MLPPYVHRWLLPLSCLYGWGVAVRNWAFDRGWLPQRAFDLPVICIGNLSVGGTGKTPHAEYVLRLLCERYHTAVLSRGYRRRSKGFVLARPGCTADEIGDEPCQMWHKLRGITVAVCADRCAGIERLLALQAPRIEAIVLDDAFQHRYVKPGLSIVLTPYHRLCTDDRLLPAGRLREPASGLARASIVVVSKCPPRLSPMERRILRRKLNLRPYQSLFLTTYCYGEPYAFDTGSSEALPERPDVLLLTGIADNGGLLRHVEARSRTVQPLTFADHHAFTPTDVAHIGQAFDHLPHGRRIILTTEKDAARLAALGPEAAPWLRHVWVQPIEVAFVDGKQHAFNQKILHYVESNSRNQAMA